jgi:hypothetical protein
MDLTMTQIKVVGLTIVAVLALSALGAASVSAAQPEWFKSGAKLGASVKDPFTGAAGVGVLELAGGIGLMKCAKDTSAGEIEGPLKETKVFVTYAGCLKGAKKCTSAGRAAGEIKTNEIVGENIYLDAPHTQAGILLTPKVGTAFANFTCEGESAAEVTGGVIGEAKPLNSGDSNTGKLIFAQENGQQEWRQVAGTGGEIFLKAFGGLIKSGIGGGEKLTEKLVETMTFMNAVELHT